MLKNSKDKWAITNSGLKIVNFAYRAILDLQMALAVLTEVMASLWPLDPTPRLLNRLFIEYEFAAAYGGSELERCR